MLTKIIKLWKWIKNEKRNECVWINFYFSENSEEKPEDSSGTISDKNSEETLSSTSSSEEQLKHALEDLLHTF